MNRESPATRTAQIEEYFDAWAGAASQVLGQVSGTSVTVEPLAPTEAATLAASLGEQGSWVRFAAGKRLAGEQAFLVASADAVRLAQMLMAEPLDANVPFGEDQQDALAELLRQFAGTTAPALKPRLGGEVEFNFVGTDRPTWAAAYQAAWRLLSAQTPPLVLCLALSPELGAALAGTKPPPTPAPPSKLEAAIPSAPAAEPPGGRSRKQVAEANDSGRARNIELLLDVEFEAVLRFGQSEMPLRDILELSSGSVVKLDQHIQEPVELLVGHKVIARGEVVVVDGNYGLRVTEIASPLERIESLR